MIQIERNDYEVLCINELKSAIKEVEKTNNYVVDLGCSNNSWFLEMPYSGLLVDADIRKIMTIPPGMYKGVARMVTTENVHRLFEEFNVPKDFMVLNLDIDGPDLWILMKILERYEPKVIVTEINEKIPYPVKFSIKNDPNFDWGWCHLYGYSFACLEDVMTRFGYRIKSLTMNNAVLVKGEPNVEDLKDMYVNGYLEHPSPLIPPSWNDDVKHLHGLDKEEVATEWRNYFLNNPNPNNGEPQTKNINNYVINDDYEDYLKRFFET